MRAGLTDVLLLHRRRHASVQHNVTSNATRRRKNEVDRNKSLVTSQAMYDERVGKGCGYINMSRLGSKAKEFCRELLSLKDTGHANVVVNSKSLITVDGEIYTPLQLIDGKSPHEKVLVYAGITSQVDTTRRPGEYIQLKFGYNSREEMLADGWIIVPDVVSFPEPDFLSRRYTTAWTERLVQLCIEDVGDWVKVQWPSAEPAPVMGENRSGLTDNGMNSLYLCFKVT
jgi:hypothetical protein